MMIMTMVSADQLHLIKKYYKKALTFAPFGVADPLADVGIHRRMHRHLLVVPNAVLTQEVELYLVRLAVLYTLHVLCLYI